MVKLISKPRPKILNIMKTTVTVEPMDVENSIFKDALAKVEGPRVDLKNSFELIITCEHAGQKTVVNFPITPTSDPGLVEKINWGVDFTRQKMVDYLQRKDKTN